MTSQKLFPMLPNPLLDEKQYHAMYTRSIQNPHEFWAEYADKMLTWFKPWDTVLSGSFKQSNVEWFSNGKLNACYNCLDRHLPQRANQVAMIWEGNETSLTRKITYAEMYEQVCCFANVLKKFSVKKGDRVGIYLPMIPEAIIAMLACARIGAIHSVIFAGFSAEAIKSRLINTNCHIVISADEGLRGNKTIPLKITLEAAIGEIQDIHTVIVVKRTACTIPWQPGRDHWYHDEMEQSEKKCPCEIMDANDPLFILYTSGSTGLPKGILHVTGGYLVYTALTQFYIFNHQEQDVYWCTADIGWITGHSYVIYGPLCNGITLLLFEGMPNYPSFSRYWDIIDKHSVNIFYTSPTAIRMIRREGNTHLTHSNRHSLRILGTVGEPINPEVWRWYYDRIGNQHCPIVDTWWQTETGGIAISAIPGTTPLKPGSVTWPFWGIKPAILNDAGQPVSTNQTGKLVITQPWPGLCKTIYNDHRHFIDLYFREFPGYYLTGDDAYYDEDGYFWIIGRNDDVLNVSGHRIGTAEVENALLTHPAIAEAAVVSIPDDIKGEALYVFITPQIGIKPSPALEKELIQITRQSIGAIATPSYIQWANALPKTRSGKIMRRLLKKIANNCTDSLGDISTLEDQQVITDLLKERKNVGHL